jgi:TonB family protein
MAGFVPTIRLILPFVILSSGPTGPASRSCYAAGGGSVRRSPARALPGSGQSIAVDQDLTPLMRAARDQERDSIKQLLKGNPDLNAKDQDGWTASTYAALNGNATILKALIQKGADVNSRDNHGMSPLMNAASYGNAPAAKILVEKGADVNAKDDEGRTALTFAERRKSDSVIKLLQKAGGVNPLAGVVTASPQPLEPTGKDARPVALNRPRPDYTEIARKHRVSGIVRMRILVGQDGSVKRMRAVTGLPDGLTYEAYRAAYQMKFRPATKDGQPVNFWQAIEVEFQLR